MGNKQNKGKQQDLPPDPTTSPWFKKIQFDHPDYRCEVVSLMEIMPSEASAWRATHGIAEDGSIGAPPKSPPTTDAAKIGAWKMQSDPQPKAIDAHEKIHGGSLLRNCENVYFPLAGPQDQKPEFLKLVETVIKATKKSYYIGKDKNQPGVGVFGHHHYLFETSLSGLYGPNANIVLFAKYHRT